MDKIRITYLIEQYLTDAATAQELHELERLLAAPNADPIIKDVLQESFYHLPDVAANQSDKDTKERIFQHIVMQSQHRPSSMAWRLRPWLPYAAAAIVIMLSVGLLVWNTERPTLQEIAATEIYPVAGGATLSLADGRIIELDHAHGGITVGAGTITYDGGDSSVVELGGVNRAVEQLTLSTPRGSTYAITLPDGSRVWLNTATTLSYPSRFAETERLVYLEGEAYFSVNNKPVASRNLGEVPFRVISNGQEVQVLGTEFNISAYSDDSEIQTTLIEGRVRVSTGQGTSANATAQGSRVVLKPGEQAVSRGGAIVVEPVNVIPFTAWKDNLFYFERSSPQTAIEQLARWYDLDVVYEGKIPKVNIFGVIDRSKSLGSVLKALEKSGLRFKVVRGNEVHQLTVLGEQ